MKKESLKDKLLKYLRAHNGFIHGGELEKIVIGWGYKASTGGRCLRILAEEGTILRKENDKGHVLYSGGKPKQIIEYRVDNQIVSIKHIW